MRTFVCEEKSFTKCFTVLDSCTCTQLSKILLFLPWSSKHCNFECMWLESSKIVEQRRTWNFWVLCSNAFVMNLYENCSSDRKLQKSKLRFSSFIRGFCKINYLFLLVTPRFNYFFLSLQSFFSKTKIRKWSKKNKFLFHFHGAFPFFHFLSPRSPVIVTITSKWTGAISRRRLFSILNSLLRTFRCFRPLMTTRASCTTLL